MMREILLARRLLEDASDPDASRSQSEAAAAELVEVGTRLGVPPGRAIPFGSLEGLEVGDLSPAAWLHLLENRNPDDPEIPAGILETLFLEYSDSVLRFRLVSGALAQPEVQSRYASALKERPDPQDISELPDSWPKRRLIGLEKLAAEPETGSRSAPQALQELILYLLQDGTHAALALAAAAITPGEDWRRPAREIVRSTVLHLDPEMTGYGRAFRRARLRD
jgi:hypothetical protein